MIYGREKLFFLLNSITILMMIISSAYYYYHITTKIFLLQPDMTIILIGSTIFSLNAITRSTGLNFFFFPLFENHDFSHRHVRPKCYLIDKRFTWRYVNSSIRDFVLHLKVNSGTLEDSQHEWTDCFSSGEPQILFQKFSTARRCPLIILDARSQFYSIFLRHP